MNGSIYSRLAVTNLKNNHKTYVPYILTAVLTVMMFYIMDALARNGGIVENNLKLILSYARGVIIVFAVIFLFYTNSFLIKRRKREIGVYNILGMGKRHIARMLFTETLITAVIGIGAGLVAGLVFSKLMYLALFKILHFDVGLEFSVSVPSLMDTLVLFLVIFLLTLIYNLMQIRLANPVELLQGSRQGEREPKTKILLAIIGFALIGAGYTIALITESPLEAISSFFIAVVCVILGTYALFVAGSIAFLKALRKKKSFYYQAKHFTSVSGMIYRMKQNAVGLANICILSTMVLVMISTTLSLYAGMDDILRYRFPTEYGVILYQTTPEGEEQTEKIISEEMASHNVTVDPDTELVYRQGAVSAILRDGGFDLKETGDYSTSEIREVYMIPEADYNSMEGENISLDTDEVLVYSTGENWGEDQLQMGIRTYQVEGELDTLKLEPKNRARVVEAYYLIMSDEEEITKILKEAWENSDMSPEWIAQQSAVEYIHRFDLDGDKKDCTAAEEAMTERLTSEVAGTFCESRQQSRENFYGLYGSLFFIGIYLGALFLMATVLIIYYKQISEGYDDKERFQIMQKVGMDQKEVRRTIRSQVLTVFFLPLFMAVLHVAVAFQVIKKLMVALNFTNTPLFLLCTVITVAVFAVFYAIVYGITAREYYKIVRR